jgi:hypothetical protein
MPIPDDVLRRLLTELLHAFDQDTWAHEDQIALYRPVVEKLRAALPDHGHGG